MKKIIKILVLLLSINLYCQPGVIVPLNTLSYEVQDGTYIKDLDNEYLPYVGTWKGTLNGKEYTFVFQFFAQHLFSYPTGRYYYEDILKAKYEVKDITTGNVLFTTMSATTYDEFMISGLGTVTDGRLDFLFMDASRCYNSMKFALENIPGVINQLHYGGFRYESFDANGCQYANWIDIPVVIPKKGLIFTKQ